MIEPRYQSDKVQLFCADCLEVLPQLEAGSVDAVVKQLAVTTACGNINREGECNHEGSTGGEQAQKAGSGDNLDQSEDRTGAALQRTGVVSNESCGTLRRESCGNPESDEASGHEAERDGKQRGKKRKVQERSPEYTLSKYDNQGEMFELRSNRKTRYTSQERGSYRQSPGEFTGSLRIVPQQADEEGVVGSKKNIVCITDPPYGTNKAEWDTSFPVEWYSVAKSIAKTVVIITGSAGLKDTIPLIGLDFVDCIAARNLNSLTRGPIGFNNWLAAVIAGERPAGNSWNFFEFAVRGEMPDHPSPKPIEYMRKLIERITPPAAIILDPFMSSGTTGVAAMQTGRRFIGIEIDPTYYEIAERRIKAAEAQLRLDI